MKLKALLLALFAAGLAASFALASPPPGKGRSSSTSTSTTGTTSTTKGKAPVKVAVCHKTGKNKYVIIKVAKKSAPALLKRTGDVLAVNGTCPGPIQGHTGTTKTTTTNP